MTRAKRGTLTFSRAFKLKGVERSLPAGAYELVTDEELIEGLSFPAYRRVGSWLIVPGHISSASIEMTPVDPVELAAAHVRDPACVISPAAPVHAAKDDETWSEPALPLTGAPPCAIAAAPDHLLDGAFQRR